MAFLIKVVVPFKLSNLPGMRLAPIPAVPTIPYCLCDEIHQAGDGNQPAYCDQYQQHESANASSRFGSLHYTISR
ncbi:MAG TPA: hypothetical protein VKG24_12595 [Pseudolabrys sp.]|nr:hypothetical protein [Pseudolabrys sp.]